MPVGAVHELMMEFIVAVASSVVIPVLGRKKGNPATKNLAITLQMKNGLGWGREVSGWVDLKNKK